MPKSGPMISIVDDDLSVRRALRRLIGSAGYLVETFASAHEFLDALPGRRAACLVLDIHLNPSLPWSINGNSGAAPDTFQLAGLNVRSIELNTGASREHITLGKPSGIVPITINGGALTVHLHRPAGTLTELPLATTEWRGIRLPAAGGAYLGNQVEKSKTQVVYQIGVKYDDGSWATIGQAAPTGLRIGDRVRVTDSGVELLR